jgi:hypothetical protein
MRFIISAICKYYVPKPTLQLVAKLNTTNPFKNTSLANENKIKSTVSGTYLGVPIHLTYECESNLTTGTINHSVGVDGGIGSGNKIENGVSNSTSNMNASKQVKFD